jgi:hypothetical protein
MSPPGTGRRYFHLVRRVILTKDHEISFFFRRLRVLPPLYVGELDAPFLWRTAAVMRNGVMSRINLTRRPPPAIHVWRCSTRTSPFTMTRACCIPCVIDCLAAVPAAVLAARFLFSLLGSRRHRRETKKSPPRNVVMVMMVLLKLA